MRLKFKTNKIIFIIYLFVFLLSIPFSALAAGNIGGNKYAWSNNVGYINFENVTVTDDALLGYAWSKNAGWIRLDPPSGGVKNNNGDLSGYAWGEQLGWINFDNVYIDTSTGKFSGTATGDRIGILTFDCPIYCDVRTFWRPSSSQANGNVGGFVGFGVGTNNNIVNANNNINNNTNENNNQDANDLNVDDVTDNNPDNNDNVFDKPQNVSENQYIDNQNVSIKNKNINESATKQEVSDVISSPKSDDNQLNLNDNFLDSKINLDNVISFYEKINANIKDLRKNYNYVESYNKPLTISSNKMGVLIQDFSTPDLIDKGKRKGVIIELPQNLTKNKVTFYVNEIKNEKISNLPLPKDNLEMIFIVDINAKDENGNNINKFDKKFKITLVVPEDLKKRDNISVYYLEDGKNNWIKVDDVVLNQNSVDVYVDHLTKFSIFASSEGVKEASLSNQKQPNIKDVDFLTFLIVLILLAGVILYVYYKKSFGRLR